MIYDPDAQEPLYVEVTTARVNDITVAKAMPIEPGATYVFDLGYYDYGWWAKLNDAGCRIVSRLKANTPLTLVAEQALPEGSSLHLRSHRHVAASASRSTRQQPVPRPGARDRRHCSRAARRCASSPMTSMPRPMRSPSSTSAAGRSSCSSAGSSRPSGSGTSVGHSENAVRIQIAVALIACLILNLATRRRSFVPSPLAFTRLVSANLMHKRHIHQLLEPSKTPPSARNMHNHVVQPATQI